MRDTEWKEKVSEIVPGTPLDAERFFRLDVLDPTPPGYVEPLVIEGEQDGQLWLIYCEIYRDSSIHFKVSEDAGRTWRQEWTARDTAGRDIPGFHVSVLRLQSGRLGMIYSAANKDFGHPGREHYRMVHYRSSDDGGHTWSDPVLVARSHSCCCTGHAVVLSSGRILAPSFRWISPQPGEEAEDSDPHNGVPSPTFCYSIVHVSDDEGKTWSDSLSELYVSEERKACDLVEPTVIELKDGRVLMHLRAEMGRMYKCYSSDGGTTWTWPEAVHIAAAYAPCMIRRIPSTAELLMVWSQASRQEIICSRSRMRLTCAISRDEGETWENFRNLESLDDVTQVTPPPAYDTTAYVPYEVYSHLQPAPKERFHRVPGILRVCYPTIAFAGDEVAVAYDIGYGTLGKGLGARLRVIPVEWFRG